MPLVIAGGVVVFRLEFFHSWREQAILADEGCGEAGGGLERRNRHTLDVRDLEETLRKK